MESGSNLPLSEESSIRYFPCVNMTDEWIPGRALMQLYGYQSRGDRGYGLMDDEGEAIVRVEKPGTLIEQHQNPAVLWINGPVPIPPYGEGRCTRSWPVQVLHDGREDSLGPGMPCGPKAGRWEVYSTGHAFGCLGHNAATDFVPPQAAAAAGASFAGHDNLHTVWIDASPRPNQGAFFSIAGRTAVLLGPAERLSYFGTDPYSTGFVGQTRTGEVPVSDWADYDEDLEAWVVKDGFNGLYHFSLSATIWADTDDEFGNEAGSDPQDTDVSLRGYPLHLTVNHERPVGDTVQTMQVYSALRYHDIETDEYGKVKMVTKENVAVSGLLNLLEGDRFYILNATAANVWAHFPTFQIHRVAPSDFILSRPPGE